MLKLTIEDDEGKTTVIPVIRDEMTIGRQDGNTIRLTERNVSRRHARLLRQNGVVYVEDLASFTGVKLNGARISAVMPIRDGDQLQIGDYKIVLKSDRPSDRPLPAPPPVEDPATTQVPAVRPSTPAMGSRGLGAASAVSAAVAIATRHTSAEPITARATPEPLEGQPTIPVRALGDVAAPGREAAPTPARLVVLSTELAGMEFTIDRASVVLGRTDENDFQLNHRSISRHHAKVVRDHDRYTIVDLQSANGVRVNGEDYERIELNPGDVVELGHVKMRFVGPFELYVFDPQAARRAERKVPAKLVFTLVGVVMAAVALVAIRRIAGGSKGSAESPALVAEASSAGALARAPASPTPAVAAAPPPVAPPPVVNEAERRGAVAFAKFDEASTAKNYASALDWFEAIPEESLYKQRARPRFEEARMLFVAEHLTAAEKFRSQGRCADARVEAEEVGKIDPRNQLVKDLLKLCKPRPEPSAVVAVTTAPRLARAKGGAGGGGAREGSRSEAGSAPAAAKSESASPVRLASAGASEAQADPDVLMKQAREAWIHQHCGSAIDSARRALKAKPGLNDAYQIIAVCSCSLRDVEGASRAYSKLDEKSRPLARSLCQKNGIALYSGD